MRPKMAKMRPKMPNMRLKRPKMAKMRAKMTKMRAKMAKMRPKMAKMKAKIAKPENTSFFNVFFPSRGSRVAPVCQQLSGPGPRGRGGRGLKPPP